jgi:hypothetical protein
MNVRRTSCVVRGCCWRVPHHWASRTKHSASAAEPNAILRCLPNRGEVPSAYPSTMFASTERVARRS